MGRARKELEALTAQVDKGELKELDKIGAAAARNRLATMAIVISLGSCSKAIFAFRVLRNLPWEKALEGST